MEKNSYQVQTNLLENLVGVSKTTVYTSNQEIKGVTYLQMILIQFNLLYEFSEWVMFIVRLLSIFQDMYTGQIKSLTVFIELERDRLKAIVCCRIALSPLFISWNHSQAELPNWTCWSCMLSLNRGLKLWFSNTMEHHHTMSMFFVICLMRNFINVWLLEVRSHQTLHPSTFTCGIC